MMTVVPDCGFRVRSGRRCRGKRSALDCTYAASRICPGAPHARGVHELVDQDADFEPYLDWLDKEIERRGIG